MAFLWNSYGNFDSLASKENLTVFKSGARPLHASKQYANYSFIAVLGLAQRLGIRILPITWQPTLGRIGKGGQAGINEAVATRQTSFAFKLFNRPQQHPLGEVAQEMVVLSHPTVRSHNHIVVLEGICWDISEDDQVWPVLVFEKSVFGDLHKFVQLERFSQLSIEEKLNLCGDIGVAVRDMHQNGIVHGDIKPANVLLFEEKSRIIAKVADFGFATCFQGPNDWIVMPNIWLWNAPEYHTRPIRPENAKRMDVYSFGLLCFWLIFEGGSSGGLPPPPNTNPESDQSISFQGDQVGKDLIQLWKKDDRLLDWICWQVHRDCRLGDELQNRFSSFFRSTLAFEPESRCTDFDELLDFIIPNRVMPKTESFDPGSVPEHEDFQISLSLVELYNSDFRLREFITACLKFESVASGSTRTAFQQMSTASAALQLAIVYTIGFGTMKNDERATMLLNQHSLGSSDYQDHLTRIRDGNDDSLNFTSKLYSQLQHQGDNPTLDYPQYYRDRYLQERAETRLRQEIADFQQVFGQDHWLSLNLILLLGMILESQGRYDEAEELFKHVLDISLKIFGEEGDFVVLSMKQLASICFEQKRWKEAKEFQLKVFETNRKKFGADHRSVLASLGNMAAIHREQGRWAQAEPIELQLMNTNIRVLGAKHPETLTSMANLAATLRRQAKWGEAAELVVQVMELSSEVLSKEHPNMLSTMADLASTLSLQGQIGKAEELEMQVMNTSARVLGEEHPDTLLRMGNLAKTFMDQEEWVKAEELQLKTLKLEKRVFGTEHPDTLTSMVHLSEILWYREQWEVAERLGEEAVEIGIKALGWEHPVTLEALSHLVVLAIQQERWNEAEQLGLQIIEAKFELYGPKHPSTIASNSNMVTTYRGQGRWTEAEELSRIVIESGREVFGTEHPKSLFHLARHAHILKACSREDEATSLLEECFRSQEKILGSQHTTTISTLETLKKWENEKAQNMDHPRELVGH